MSDHAIAFPRDDEQRAARWLAVWDGHGIHRTATAGDNTGVEWLAAEARALGASVSIEEFALDRLDPITTFLEIGGERIEGVPVFDAPATDEAGVVGRLGAAGGEGEIAVAELSARAVYTGEYERLRRTSTHRGLVIVCTGEAPGLGLNNAEDFRRPYGVPAIYVSSEARGVVLAAATQGAMGRMVAESRRVRAFGRNLVVEVPSTEPSRPPLVVMTPRSSWWQSVSERGGGIVCWLESLRALLVGSPPRSVVFTANTGHELGLLGLDDFAARYLAGIGCATPAVRLGSYTALILVLQAARCRSCRRRTIYAMRRPMNYRGSANRTHWSLKNVCPMARPAIFTALALTVWRLTALTGCFICRRTAGLMLSMCPRLPAPQPQERVWSRRSPDRCISKRGAEQRSAFRLDLWSARGQCGRVARPASAASISLSFASLLRFIAAAPPVGGIHSAGDAPAK